MPAIDVKMTYEDSKQKVLQRTLAFVIGGRFFMLGVTATTAQEAEADAIFERAASTLVLRSRSGGA